MASEVPSPVTKMASRYTPQTARATHAFEIEWYSMQGLGAGKFIRSASFTVGGYDWCIRYYPDGEKTEVFRALLHFIYTDSMLPSMADLDIDERIELTQHMLVAADRYDVQGLKTVCENALCERLDVETVVAMLALADQQNCNKLKSACIDFIIRPDKWDGVALSEGFSRLKRSCPSILADVLEKAIRSRKIS
ncbi:unnamed protein product [Urochloa humidicola]